MLIIGSGKMVFSFRSLSTRFLTVFAESSSSFAMSMEDLRASSDSARIIATSVSVNL